MNTKTVELLDELIDEAGKLLDNLVPDEKMVRKFKIGDESAARRWGNKMVLFRSVAGEMVKPWEVDLRQAGHVHLDAVEEPLSALQTIKYAVDKGLLARFEDIVLAKAFADLFEQGEHLFEQKYFLAAGVIFRAVLEERLRRLCEERGCLPPKARPTIHDFNQALYGQTPPVYDKSMSLNVTALASVGNDAAHNVPTLKEEDVKRLMDGLRDFLARFSV